MYVFTTFSRRLVPGVIYVKLFDIILVTGHKPDNWSVGIIQPIYKNKVVK